jgi:hypothetical protein
LADTDKAEDEDIISIDALSAESEMFAHLSEHHEAAFDEQPQNESDAEPSDVRLSSDLFRRELDSLRRTLQEDIAALRRELKIDVNRDE